LLLDLLPEARPELWRMQRLLALSHSQLQVRDARAGVHAGAAACLGVLLTALLGMQACRGLAGPPAASTLEIPCHVIRRLVRVRV
jgi:hypothetical protein